MPRKRLAARQYRKTRPPSDHEKLVAWCLENPFRLLDPKLDERMHATFADLSVDARVLAIEAAEAIEGERRYKEHLEYLRKRMAEWPVSDWARGGVWFDLYPELEAGMTPAQRAKWDAYQDSKNQQDTLAVCTKGRS